MYYHGKCCTEIKIESMEEENWFLSNISCRHGNGEDIEFWRHKWIESKPLMEEFPKLYSLYH